MLRILVALLCLAFCSAISPFGDCHPKCRDKKVCMRNECVEATWEQCIPENDETHPSRRDAGPRYKRALTKRCGPEEFDCEDGVTCAMECDGTEQCPDGKDEVNCISGCECSIFPEDREKCMEGVSFSDRESCLAEGCCWEYRNHDVPSPKCFKKTTDVLRKKSQLCEPLLANSLRENGGWKGVSNHECMCMGACCAPRKRKTMWCYKPKVCQRYEIAGVTLSTQRPFVPGTYTLVPDMTCAGPHGELLPVYLSDVLNYVYLYYYSEESSWLAGAVPCSLFFGTRWVTDNLNPDAATGGWEEADSNNDWHSSPTVTVTCLEY